MDRHPKMNYKFVTPTDNEVVQPIKSFTFFYQIASFAHPKTGRYHMRKFVCDANNRFVDIRDYYLNKKQYKTFMRTKKSKDYKCYSVYSLNNVSYPSSGDILMLNSDILNNDYDYTGFAPFA